MEQKTGTQSQGSPTLEMRIISKLEGNLNAKLPKDADRARVAKERLTALLAEAKEARDAALDWTAGDFVSVFFKKKPGAKARQAILRQAEVQAELAALRLERSARWKVLRVNVEQRVATAVCTECLAEYPLQDRTTAETIGLHVDRREYPGGGGRYYDVCAWPMSLARHWMNSHLLQVVPEQVRLHMCQARIRSRWFDKVLESEDWLYLPSRDDLPLMQKGWGTLDGRAASFWLRDVGVGDGQDGRNVLGDYYDRYNPAIYAYGIQPLIDLDLNTFPKVHEMLENRIN
jgi:hypothetical protein